MIKKIILIGMAMLMCILNGCGKGIHYNATIIGGTFKESFLKENMTLGAYYENENYDPMDPNGNEYLKDNTSPQNRTFVVTEQSQLDEMFEVFQFPIDFETKMLIVYIYTDCYLRAQMLESVRMEEDTLKIEFKIKPGKWGYNDARQPYQRTLVVELDRLDVETVSVALVN